MYVIYAYRICMQATFFVYEIEIWVSLPVPSMLILLGPFDGLYALVETPCMKQRDSNVLF